ncbi:hypothetical protein H4R24_005187 [Coemansia sp. RSA 988]|nr:hypothetical protein H4R24_005187 [Coemansia sp. RSA 988]
MPLYGQHDTPTKRVQQTTSVRELVVEHQQTNIVNTKVDVRLGDITSALNNEQYERVLAYAGSIISGPENVQPVPNANSDTGKASNLSLYDSTPAHCRRIVNVVDKEASVKDPDRLPRRNRIAGDLAERVEYVSLEALNEDLGLVERYDTFEASSRTLFDDVARLAPQLTATGLKYPLEEASVQDFAGLYSQDGCSRLSNESALTDYFQFLWNYLRNKQKDRWPNVAQESVLELFDFQKSKVPGTSQQPDGLFGVDELVDFSTAEAIFEAKWATCDPKNISDTILGQIGDYVLNVWHMQFARSYVPVIFLHGGVVTLMIFTRSRVYVALLGPICTGIRGINSNHQFIGETLRMIWFYLTLSSADLGNICRMPYSYSYLRLISGSAAGLGRVERATETENGAAKLGKRIERPIRIVRRATYMYRCMFNDAGIKRNAVLKLTWTPAYRLPEGAAYQVIGSACGNLIPQIYSSGILVPDSFGYRLEYAIMEDCGETLEEYANRCRNSLGFDHDMFGAKMVDAVKGISNCLAIAYSVGVLHRDISPGNIAINRAGQVKLIDWGCARLRVDKVIPDLDAIARKWSFDSDQDPYMETRYDSLTGTHPSMSIQVLGNCTKRSLLHDLESVFFTALYALATVNDSIDSKNAQRPLGFRHLGHEETAILRVGCLVSGKNYCKRFGVFSCSEGIKDILDTMYRALFWQGNQYIGDDLIEHPNLHRPVQPEQVKGFMDSSLFSKALLEDSEPVCEATAAKASCEDALRPMEIDSVDNQPVDQHLVTGATQKQTRRIKHRAAKREIDGGLRENVKSTRAPSSARDRDQPAASIATTRAVAEQSNRPLTRSRAHAAKKRKHS